MRTTRACGCLREMVLQYAWVRRVPAFCFKGPQCKNMMRLSVQRAKVDKGQTDLLAGKDILYRQTSDLSVLSSLSLISLAQDSGRKRSQGSVLSCWAVS